MIDVDVDADGERNLVLAAQRRLSNKESWSVPSSASLRIAAAAGR